MMNVGRICIKIAGRDAGMKGIIIDLVDKNTVLVDGQIRRRKVNIKHLEPTAATLDLEKGATHEAVVMALKQAGIQVIEHVKKERAEPKKTTQKKK